MELEHGFDQAENDEDFNSFKINTAFAERFEHNQRRKLLEQGKLKYGDRLNDDKSSQSDESSSSEDDSDAELLNPKIEQKFLQVLTAIRTNDPKLKTDKPLFSDDDFEEKGGQQKETSKPLTLKD